LLDGHGDAYAACDAEAGNAAFEVVFLHEAEKYVREGLVVAGLKEGELADLKGAEVRKILLARLVWKKTTADQEWIAKRLGMGSAISVSQQIRRLEKKAGRVDKVPKALKRYLQAHEQS
jgi:hypothetical protein